MKTFTCDETIFERLDKRENKKNKKANKNTNKKTNKKKNKKVTFDVSCKKDTCEEKHTNIFREINDWIWSLSDRPLDTAIGLYYTILHYVFIVFGSSLLLLETDVWNLTILLIIISFDAVANVLLHNCPLTALEEKYINTSMSSQRKHLLKKSGIMFKCSDIYESQIELLINVWSLTVGKILVLWALQFFNKKIVNM
jgi:hypothetical protein